MGTNLPLLALFALAFAFVLGSANPDLNSTVGDIQNQSFYLYAKEKDRITELPGLPDGNLDFSHYSGDVYDLYKIFRPYGVNVSLLDSLPKLLNSGIHILLYSGDFDALIPFSTTRAQLDKLNLNKIGEWSTWAIKPNEDVAGYFVMYKEGLTFATVKAAGHEVPSYQPQRALALLERFLLKIF